MPSASSVKWIESLSCQGESLCRGGRYAEAMGVLERAACEAGSPDHLPPRALASYGLAMIRTNRRRAAEAIRFCQAALDKNPVDAGLYHALAEVYLCAGSKRKAVRLVKKGLRLEPRHAALNRCLDRMGRRSAPTIPFLSRSNALNKLLGRLRHATKRRK